MDGWNTSFLLGWPIFRCYVSFRECMFCLLYVWTTRKNWPVILEVGSKFTGCEPWILTHVLLHLFYSKELPAFTKQMFFTATEIASVYFLQFGPVIVYSSVSELGSRSGGRGRGGWRRFRGRGECNLQHSGSLSFNQFHMVPPRCHECAVGGTVEVLTALSMLADPIPISLVFVHTWVPRGSYYHVYQKSLLSIKSFSIGRARGRERERERENLRKMWILYSMNSYTCLYNTRAPINT